jgi:hypothetical protein
MNEGLPETPQVNPEDDDDGAQESTVEEEGFSPQSEGAPTLTPVDAESYTHEVTAFRDAQGTDHILENLEKLKDRLEDKSDSEDTP